MNDKLNFDEIAKNIKSWAKDFGFNDVGISDVKLEKNKLLTIRAAENVVRILPPLNVKKSEIDLALKIIRKVCMEI